MSPFQIAPELTPLFIGRSVRIEGRIVYEGSAGERLVVLGEFKGSLDWDGIVQVPQGGHIEVEEQLRCTQLVVGGMVTGSTPDSTISTGELFLGPNATLEVGLIEVPSGRLEQARGATINGTLKMLDPIDVQAGLEVSLVVDFPEATERNGEPT